MEELLAIQAEFGRRMELITDLDGVIARLEAEVAAARKVAQSVADELTALRQRGAEALSSGVTEMLGRLGMSGARFLCRVTPDVLRESGADIIEFVFSSSPAGSLLPIEKIASGGERSRVMLCLKALAARCAKLPTIIFDEIDTGVSGRVADEMGEVITELSASMQVLNITHLPQVASKGDDHFVVYKEVTNDGAESRIRRLTTDERVEEIAKMLSGSVVTDAAREQARQLLG